ncbi:GNAT family N-acetyltransferase [Pseudomonas cremoricolorata]|uniref:Acetyltransferase n=1 Tax=Pseudomonas cremoricolorata TaxID=157783 RepID=A0A089WWD2_9PSED|nr:GNAT family N-acetyltransferase [Pseudomonas cremoricolorata]AIR90922.1 acetyltransferase [Pseudomonas cremoricolorata]
MTPWTLHEACAEHIEDIVEFVNCARKDMFPKLARSPMPTDLLDFAGVYLHGQGHFLTARADGALVAVIGYVPYDHRFAQLDYRGLKVVEVVRLFVLAQYRRGGLAAALFAALREQAQRMGVQCLYLHTHPFLPGAIEFWQRQGFAIVDIEPDPLWQTTHMLLPLTP